MVKRLASIVLVAACVGAVFAFVPPAAIVEDAFATARGAFADNATPNQPQAQRSCEDLEFWFLNSGCTNAHIKHTARTNIASPPATLLCTSEQKAIWRSARFERLASRARRDRDPIG